MEKDKLYVQVMDKQLDLVKKRRVIVTDEETIASGVKRANALIAYFRSLAQSFILYL